MKHIKEPKNATYHKVVSSKLRQRTSSYGWSETWYDLVLECGCEAERPVKYKKQVGHSKRGWSAIWNTRSPLDALPPPKKVLHLCIK